MNECLLFREVRRGFRISRGFRLVGSRKRTDLLALRIEKEL